jgi:hypothetical protein
MKIPVYELVDNGPEAPKTQVAVGEVEIMPDKSCVIHFFQCPSKWLHKLYIPPQALAPHYERGWRPDEQEAILRFYALRGELQDFIRHFRRKSRYAQRQISRMMQERMREKS